MSTLDEIRTEQVRQRGFIRAADTQGTKIIALIDALLDAASEPTPEPVPEPTPEPTPDPDPEPTPEPTPGGTVILAVDGTTLDLGPFVDLYGAAYEANWSVVTDPDAPSGKALHQAWPAGTGSGFNGALITNWAPKVGRFREIAVRYTFCLSPGWQWHSGLDKLFYVGTNQSAEYFFALRQGLLCFRDQDGAGVFYASSVRPSLGVYHTLEAVIRQNDPGQANGSMQVVFDGQPLKVWENWTGGGSLDVSEPVLALGDGDGWGGGQWGMYWGGSGDVKSSDDWLRVGGLYVAGR